ncbi:Ribose-5-P isomerase B [Moorella thermoacetica]|uniref:Ribose-5-P isomerase B n=1 Tax=Neomoorella thermoacetica TaxID=1525 RepID=A0AAC9HFG9_NEOTH|nr:ribose 5-phosphate isomerase B [Moorella thermoacetica]AOQ22743.1 Putative sugar phosphate isomerase YwlF [Moorella thermoacetica]TYL06836.1 Ribose-5-P isomerase B [Moorella thermoacetica]
MKIAIGSDHLGFNLKETLKEFIKTLGHEVIDFGCNSSEPVDYPDIAGKLAHGIARGEAERGILICGTGIGMAIAANKVKGIRAAQCHDVYSAERAAKSNNAHIITMGSLVIGSELAKAITRTWLNSAFNGGPSARKVQKIMDLEMQGENFKEENF